MATLFGPVRAAADNVEDEARVQFQQGVELYKDGRSDQAAVAFGRAYELKPSFKILYNIAQTENELGHFSAALQAYARYLADGGTEVPRDRVGQVQAEIQRLKALVGSIAIVCGIEGATVVVDRVERGRTPLGGSVFVDLGTHDVEVEKDGAKLLYRQVKVAGGETVTLEVAASGPAGGGGVEPKLGEKPVAGYSHGAKEKAKPSEAGRGERPRVWTWVAGGVGAATLVAAGIVGGVSMAAESSLKDECGGTSCPASKKGEADRIRSMNLAADVMYGVGAACVATGIVLWFVEPRMGVEASAGPTAGGAALSVRGRF